MYFYTLYKKSVFLLIAINICSQQLSAMEWKSEMNFNADGNMNQETIIKTLFFSFVIGNIIAWSMGAYPRSVEKVPYSNDDLHTISDLKAEIKEYPEESEIKKELGEIYFFHNDLDKAEDVLYQAVDEDNQNAEALAVWSANEAKQASAMWDFTWGIWKLSRLSDSIDGLNKAVTMDPENLNVRLYRLNTFEGLENRNDSLRYALDDEQWFLEKMNTTDSYFPQDVQLEFFDVLTKIYLLKSDLAENDTEKSTRLTQAKTYLKQINALPIEGEEKEQKMAYLKNKIEDRTNQ
jgi:tetratricopeptide (TPR) repeat protein